MCTGGQVLTRREDGVWGKGEKYHQGLSGLVGVQANKDRAVPGLSVCWGRSVGVDGHREGRRAGDRKKTFIVNKSRPEE